MSEKLEKTQTLVHALEIEFGRESVLLEKISKKIARLESPSKSTLNEIDDTIENHRKMYAFTETNSDIIDADLVRPVLSYTAAAIQFYELTQILNDLHAANSGRQESANHIKNHVQPALERFQDGQSELVRVVQNHEPSL